MDHRLRMDQYVDLVRGQAEQIRGLDDLQPLVHHCGAVDRNLGAHVPGRVRHRLFRCRLRHGRQICFAERTARGREDEFFDRSLGLGIQHLIDRVMLGIHRQQRRAASPHTIHHQRTGRHQAFLVGERHHGAAFRGRQGRFKPTGADDRRHHPFRRPRGGIDHRVGPGRDLDSGPGQRLLQRSIAVPIGDDRQPRLQTSRLIGEPFDVAVCRQRLDLEAIAIALDQIDGVGADRTGGTENCDASTRHQVDGRRHARTLPLKTI